MNIQLCEDDGIFFNGVPKNIVIQVTFDDGKKLRVPYSASKSISQLYEDLASVNNKEMPKFFESPIKEFHIAKQEAMIKTVEDNLVKAYGVIEKEDIVRCIKVEDRGQGATVDIKVGGEYRVIKIIKQQGVVLSYDVIDDTADTPRRIYVMPHEVEFLRKRKPPIEKTKGRFEEIVPCNACQKPVVCVKMDDGLFHGDCPACGQSQAFEPKLIVGGVAV